MVKNVDYNLLVQAERIRFRSDFSSSHWLFQVLSKYELGMTGVFRREAFESVIRSAINSGVRSAVKLAASFPDAAGFPDFLELGEPNNWEQTKLNITNNFSKHEFNRFKYVREGA